ncbi:MAG: D-2-hydroxyacid dehydrogenase [Lachnospiraceae bacterium]|nr:D-2-hydroxyacid dehydrogenase [Lachnospiraceae bacterium]
MKIVVVSDLLTEKNISLIREKAGEVKAEVSFFKKEEEALGEAREADIVYGYCPRIAAACENLKWLCLPWAGVDRLMGKDFFANKDCIFTNSAGAYGVAISEHMIGLVLMLLRRIPEFEEGRMRREWLPPRRQKSIKGSRVTVLGAGDIGCTFARRIKAFEPSLLMGVNRSGKSSEAAFDRVLSVAELDKVLPETDILAMSLPGTPETVGILSADRIGLLPPEAVVVNVGRGSAIDEKALAAALKEGRLWGAALDVFQTEPLPKDSELWDIKNLIITPHVAGNLTVDYTRDRNVEMFCEDLMNYCAGRPLMHLVDRKRGY